MMEKTKILLAEDDLNLGTILREFLELKGFAIEHAIDGAKALVKYDSSNFDLCILDVMMPKKDGFTLAKEIRAQDKDIPIIFLTAKSMQEDKLEGLRLGGDDYITKPFSSEELLLRIHNIVKRINLYKSNGKNVNLFQLGKYNFDYNKRILKFDKHEQKLTTREADLLKLLSENKNELVKRSEALKKIWNEDNYFTARSMDVYIVKLRRYLRQDKTIELTNVHGTGFKLIV